MALSPVPSARPLLRPATSATRVAVARAPGAVASAGWCVPPTPGEPELFGLLADVTPAAPPPPRRAPEDLHPALWRAHQLGRAPQAVCASGHAALDAQLPGGGWPLGVLTELLLPHPGVGELRLLAPALAALQRGQLWLDPPAVPFAWTLAALGLDLRQLVLVLSRGPARGARPLSDGLWVLEQALKGGHLGAVLAWLPPRLPADALRRLQLAAQAHDGPVFLLRDTLQCQQPSAAPLRLRLDCAGPDRLRVQLLKRRGPPLAEPLTLALPPVLSVLWMPAHPGVRTRVP